MSSNTSPTMKRLIASSWSPNTRSSYDSGLRKWQKFCRIQKWDYLSANFTKGLQFLVWLFESEQASWGVVAATRSAMSAVTPFENGVSFGNDPQVSRVLKGMFRERPQIPKRLVIYDTNIVIRYIGNLPCNKELLLEELTLKLTTFLCILSGQRSQSIGALFPKHMHKSETTFTFYIPKIIKTTTPRFHQEPLEFEAFPQERKLCVHTCLSDYLQRTEGIRENLGMDNTTLILSYQYPHHPVKSATLARYVKNFLGQAGIDLTVFTAHSTRSASSSKANNLGLSLKDISKAAGWKGHSTFQQFYKFPIQKNFGTELVKAAYMA